MAARQTSPVVSVVMPVFNASSCLEIGLRSVLTQSLVDLELIVVDDASTDESFAIATRMAEEDARVRPVQLPKNGGPSVARNHGFALARGEWIAILDADDRFEPKRLAHLTRSADARGCDMIADNLAIYDLGCDTIVATAYPELHEPTTLSLESLLRHDLSADRTPYGWLKPIWRRDFLNHHGLLYAADQRYAEDFDLLFRCLLEGARFQIVPEAGYVYTPRRGPVSGKLSHLSQTRQDFRAASAANAELLRHHGARLNPAERALLQQRMVFFASRATYSEFADLVRRGSPAALLHAARHPSVVVGAVRALRRRLTR